MVVRYVFALDFSFSRQAVSRTPVFCFLHLANSVKGWVTPFAILEDVDLAFLFVQRKVEHAVS